MGLKSIFEEIKKSIREGIEELDNKTRPCKPVNNVVAKVQNALYKDVTAAEIEYAYTTYYIEQLLSEIQDLALLIVKYENMIENVAPVKSNGLTIDASKIAKNITRIAKSISKKLVESVDSEVETENKSNVLENIMAELEKFTINCETALYDTEKLESMTDIRNTDFRNWDIAVAATKDIFNSKSDEVADLKEQLSLIKLK